MATTIGQTRFRQALGCFLTGVTIVTTGDRAGERYGLTANSFTSVSLDPPLVLACVGKRSSSYAAFSEANAFAINILGEDQKAVSTGFATKGAEKFSHGTWAEGASGSPILEGSAAWFDCKLHQRIDAGDHIILIGEVEAFDFSAGAPLGYHSGSYVTFSAEEKAISLARDKQRIIVALLERDGRLLLMKDERNWRLPRVTMRGKASGQKESLLKMLSANGISAAMTFLYTVAEDTRNDETHICYRGSVNCMPESSEGKFRMFGYADIPWSELPQHPAEANVIKRFYEESRLDQFGIYVGTLEEGDIQRVSR